MIGRRQSVCMPLLLAAGLVAGSVNAGSEAQLPQSPQPESELQSEPHSQSPSDSVIGQTIDADEINRVLALSDDIEYGEYLAGECASCHLDNRGADSKVPVIHGAEPEHLVRALLEFRAGVRSNTTMGLVANGLDDEEIAAIVQYLASANQ